ncbi:inorganic phosphate transporter 2-1, chloroplastic [Humulus lupulus]|uniref:inorganic phosphate transporter 2-1, chloroplastic n=1 Tax=Humulus lupulus TaxID=3486 RepID=UPI002B40251C|nr:inorganic phosphate transporter 2-1, chloroplastic [Humulus lupulus]
MTPSFCLSSSRNATTASAASDFLLHNHHFYLPRYRYSLFSNEAQLPRKENTSFKPYKPFLANLRLKSSNFSHTFASLSSFAEAEGGGEHKEGITVDDHHNHVKAAEEQNEENLPGMAQAFNISSNTATAISICMAFAALTLPLFMKTLGQGLTLKTKLLSYTTLLFGFYMAWNIGANDVANAMGTSVGSGALTLRQAVLTAGVLEFSGALMMGTHVTNTMQKGILVANVFQGKDSLLFAGLLSSLAAAGTWLQVASYFGWPVSTTHCIVGSMVGFGLVYGGSGAVFWSSLARVTSSWVISPLMGAAASFLVYKCIRRFVYSAHNPGEAAAASAPIAVFMGVTGISFAAFPLSKVFPVALAQALACGTAGAVLVDRIIRKQLGHLIEKAHSSEEESKEDTPQNKSIGFLSDIAGPKGTQLEIVYGVFGYMQILSACFMSFAHGGNDVSNAIGPLAAALSILHGGSSGTEIVIPMDVLAWGGFGIVAGLMMWGYRVIATIGKKITELTPTRGFAAEFAAASVVLFASKLGLPISATHTLVGAVMGVGFARGLNNVRSETVREIVLSWAVTIPVGALFSVIYTWILTKLLPNIL